jgi:hypothetical protein
MEKGLVMMVGVAVRFVSVDKRRRRDVVLSIEGIGYNVYVRCQVRWVFYVTSFDITSHIASARVRCGGLDSRVCMTSQ